MYPVSTAVAALFEAENAQVLRITGTDANGVSINITDANIMQGGFSIDRYSCNGTKIELGTAVAAELKLKLNNADGTFDSIVFEGAELFVEIGVADWSLASPTVSYVPCGYFICEEQPRNSTIISLTALDRMTLLDVPQPTLVEWVDENNNNITDAAGNELYFAAEIVFPTTVSNLVSQICSLCGITLAASISSLPNASYSIAAFPKLQQTITYRNLIQWCAGMMGTCAFMDWNGQLRFKWYTSASYTSTPAKRYSSDLQESDITITGVSYTNTQNSTLVSGDGDYTVSLTGNYLVSGGEATILPNVKNALNGFTYRPFTASVISAPWLWPLDVITFTDKDGVNHSCIVTNVNIALNSHTALAGKGETVQANESASPSGATTDQGLLIEQVAEATAQLDASLNQEEVFNRLTNNGETQGVILYNGQIYINASYINTGTLNADLIKAGTLDASLVNVTNINASNITAGSLNADRISAGILSSGDGSTYFDLDNAELVTTSPQDNVIKISEGVITFYDYDGNTTGYIDGRDTWLNIDGPSVVIGDVSGSGARLGIGNGEITIYGDLVVDDAIGNNTGLYQNVTISGTTLVFAAGILVEVS